MAKYEDAQNLIDNSVPGMSGKMGELRDAALGVRTGGNGGNLAASATMPNNVSTPPVNSMDKKIADPFGAGKIGGKGIPVLTPEQSKSAWQPVKDFIKSPGETLDIFNKPKQPAGGLGSTGNNQSPTNNPVSTIAAVGKQLTDKNNPLAKVAGTPNIGSGRVLDPNAVILKGVGSENITSAPPIDLNKKYGVDKQGLLPSGKPFEPTKGSFSVQSREQMWGTPAEKGTGSTDMSTMTPGERFGAAGERAKGYNEWRNNAIRNKETKPESKSPFPSSTMKFTPQTFKPGELGSDIAGREAMGIKGNYIDGSGMTDQQYALKNMTEEHAADGERIRNMKPSQVTEMKALTDKYEKDAGTLATFKALESKSGDLQTISAGDMAFKRNPDGSLSPFAYNPGPDKTAGKRSPEAAKADQSLGQFMKQNPTATMSEGWNNTKANILKKDGWRIINKNGRMSAKHPVTGEIYPISETQDVPEEAAE